jgi:hypothetical protein
MRRFCGGEGGAGAPAIARGCVARCCSWRRSVAALLMRTERPTTATGAASCGLRSSLMATIQNSTRRLVRPRSTRTSRSRC